MSSVQVVNIVIIAYTLRHRSIGQQLCTIATTMHKQQLHCVSKQLYHMHKSESIVLHEKGFCYVNYIISSRFQAA